MGEVSKLVVADRDQKSRAPYLSPKCFKQYTKLWNRRLKRLFSISHHLGNPKFPDLLTLPDTKIVEPISIFIFFQNMVGPKQLASPSASKNFSVVES